MLLCLETFLPRLWCGLAQVEWAVVIDNSGSMAVFDRTLYETLALVFEFFRKMECRFAVRSWCKPLCVWVLDALL
jgi:hypothetical protein